MAKYLRKVSAALKARQDGMAAKQDAHLPGSMNAHKTGKRGNGPRR